MSVEADNELDRQFLDQSIGALIDSQHPLLIGVRHHSAALARVVPHLLEAFQVETLLVELPSDVMSWIDYLSDDDTEAPVALSAAGADGTLFFYPFADFSPELTALRWARRNGVPVVACDLATSAVLSHERSELSQRDEGDEHSETGAVVDSRSPQLLARA